MIGYADLFCDWSENIGDSFTGKFTMIVSTTSDDITYLRLELLNGVELCSFLIREEAQQWVRDNPALLHPELSHYIVAAAYDVLMSQEEFDTMDF